jgi:hypothetical protein
VTTAYPLKWPEGWPRSAYRKSAAFKVDYDKAVRELGYEIERLGGRYPVLSTNQELRVDGTPKRNTYIGDTGVAVYFEVKGKQKVFACDTYNTVKDNIRAISKTIEAVRSIERYGASALLERTLSAFDALPAPDDWRATLGFEKGSRPTEEQITKNFRLRATNAHPDSGGSHDAMSRLNKARADAMKELHNGR